jgi:hypothetical protein
MTAEFYFASDVRVFENTLGRQPCNTIGIGMESLQFRILVWRREIDQRAAGLLCFFFFLFLLLRISSDENKTGHLVRAEPSIGLAKERKTDRHREKDISGIDDEHPTSCCNALLLVSGTFRCYRITCRQ